MIIYSAKKEQFIEDVLNNQIEQKILSAYREKTGHSTSPSEIASWQNSMLYMNNVVSDPEIPADAGVAIEYKIPGSSKRIDFVLTGLNKNRKNVAILIELKQWHKAEITGLNGIVKTLVGGGIREVSHPSYQVWSYATLLEDYNTTVQDSDIQLFPAAYLHNYMPDDVISNSFYDEYTSKAPVFYRTDSKKLQDFIKDHVRYGDMDEILYQIDNGKIRPSKHLADRLESMLNGNQEFVLIDEQKEIYEKALQLASEASDEVHNVLIVQGGPGTGKSVVAMNLLVELTKRGLVAQYVTQNSAPRQVYEAKLTGSMTKSSISNLFTSSGSFTETLPNTYDVLIVDEAHRLRQKSGLYANKGENQIKEIIQSAKFSIFFIDEDQRVTLADIGDLAEIYKWAGFTGANILERELSSQFRANGSDGYIAWLDQCLGIHDTANDSIADIDYDFRVIESPSELHKTIQEKNQSNNKSRMVAGYCWTWPSAKSPAAFDITIGNYEARWNLKVDGQAWIIKPNSINEVGCIHTCQGLELDYVGVIIGPDFVVRNGQVVTDATKRASSDKSVFGYKKLARENPDRAMAVADLIIKNTYRTLMTRGMKGCYIYCTDVETQEYFKNLLNT